MNNSILVTGGSGQLAQALKKNKIKKNKFKYFFTSKKKLDICKYKEIESFIIKNKINIIINCAAFTNVDLAEINVTKANKVNNLSVKNLSLICIKYKILLVQISTDYVFNGNKKKFFFEYDKSLPKNKYGLTKLMGEKQILGYDIDSIIIRTSWLYSEFSNNFVKNIFNIINKNKNIELRNNSYGSPTYADDLAKFIYLVLSKKKYLFLFKKNYIFHFANLGCISRYQFVKKIIEFSQIKNIKIIKSYSNKNIKNIRPNCSCLKSKNLKIIKEFKYIKWDKSLLKCINKLKKINEKN